METDEDSTHQTQPSEAVLSEDNDDKQPQKMTTRQKQLEQKRRAIKEERLRKQREMEALLAEEEALLEAEEDKETLNGEHSDRTTEAANGTDEEEQTMDTTVAAAIDDSFSADGDEAGHGEGYETRSESGSQGEFAGETEQADTHEEEAGEESKEGDEQETAGDSDAVECREPPPEGGLAGLEEEEEEDYAELMDDDTDTQDEVEPDDRLKKAISPVTWDVDVTVNEDNDNISVDSPMHSDAGENSDAEPDGDKERKESTSSTGQEQTKSDEKTATKSVAKTSIEEAEAMRPRVHKYLYREAKYYMVKSNNHENVRLAKAKGVWSTPPQNEIRFNKAIDDNTTVILVFSVKESGAFQGFARVNGGSQKDGPKINWVLPPGISARALSGVFRLDWISRTDLSFQKTVHLRNPWNLNKPIKIARDGQELEPRSGEELCKLFTLDGSSDYERVISRVKRKRESLQTRGVSTNKSTRPPPNNSRDNSDSRGRGGYRGGLRSASSYTRGPPPHYHSRSNNHHSSGPPPLMGYNAAPAHGTHYHSSNNRNSYNNDYNRSGHNHGANNHRGNYPPSNSSAPYQQAEQYPSGYSDLFVKSSYEEYLENMRRAGNFIHDMPSAAPMGHYGAAGRDGPPPPPIPSYSSSSRDRDRDRDRGRTNPDRYERDVEDFLRRTSSSRSYSSRTESSSHRSSGSDRYRESRTDHRTRDRERSRSRDRDRSYRDRR